MFGCGKKNSCCCCSGCRPSHKNTVATAASGWRTALRRHLVYVAL